MFFMLKSIPNLLFTTILKRNKFEEAKETDWLGKTGKCEWKAPVSNM